MMKISIAFLAAISLAAFGCHQNKNKGREVLAKMTELKDKMCACKDKACSDKVSGELTEWNEQQAKSSGDKPVTPSADEARKLEEVTEELTQCLLKLEVPSGAGAAGPAGAAGAAGTADGTMGSGSAAGGAAGGAGGTMGSGSPAAGSADGSAAAGSAH